MDHNMYTVLVDICQISGYCLPVGYTHRCAIIVREQQCSEYTVFPSGDDTLAETWVAFRPVLPCVVQALGSNRTYLIAQFT